MNNKKILLQFASQKSVQASTKHHDYNAMTKNTKIILTVKELKGACVQTKIKPEGKLNRTFGYRQILFIIEENRSDLNNNKLVLEFIPLLAFINLQTTKHNPKGHQKVARPVK